jgi:HEPN pEK499 p136
MVMPHDTVRDIMHRTMQNLQFVEEHAGVDGPYEVTQLINSFLGALAHPWETYRDDLIAMTLADASAGGWPAIGKERPTDREADSLGDLVRLMRNALAHGNVEILPDASTEIRALRLWNTDRGRRTWGAVVTVADMRSFLTRFVALAEKLHGRRPESRPQIA